MRMEEVRQHDSSPSLRKGADQEDGERRASDPCEGVSAAVLVEQFCKKKETGCTRKTEADVAPSRRRSKEVDHDRLECCQHGESQGRGSGWYRLNSMDARPEPHSSGEKAEFTQDLIRKGR